MCFLCLTRYTPGHKCDKSQLYQLVVEFSRELESDLKSSNSDKYQGCHEKLEGGEPEVESGSPILSLHALTGSQGHNTLRFVAQIGQYEVVILMDSGSTHNFIDSKLVKQARLSVDLACKLRVLIADGRQLVTNGIFRLVKWEAQRYQFVSDFMVLLIKGCDMVLGVQWLHSLELIIWNFASLIMQFDYMGEACTLQGIKPGVLHVFS